MTALPTIEILGDGEPGGRVRIGTFCGRAIPAAACRWCWAMTFEDTLADDQAALGWILDHLRTVHRVDHVTALAPGEAMLRMSRGAP